MKRKLSERGENIRACIQSVYTSPDGKQMIDELCEYCGHGQDVFVKDSERQSCFNQGKQHVSNFLKRLLEEK